jgi:hypothetical protein
VRHAADRFHVVDNGGFAEESDRGRERGLGSRVSALTFERIQESGLFPTNVTATAEMEIKLQTVSGTENVLSQIAVLV